MHRFFLLRLTTVICMPQMVVAAPCFYNPALKSLNPLVTKIRRYQAVGRRYDIDKVPKEVDMGFLEKEQMKGAVGKFVCPSVGRKPGSESTAFLLERDDEIVTTAHSFGDRVDKRDLTKCYFENYMEPPVRRYLAASSERNVVPYGVDLDASPNTKDRMRLKLSSAVPNAVPIKSGDPSRTPFGGTQTILVMARNIDRKSGKGPTVSSCSVKSLVVGDEFQDIKSDCDADSGGSGGVFLVREDGELRAKAVYYGMAAESFKKVPDGTAYDENNNYALGTVITDKFFE